MESGEVIQPQEDPQQAVEDFVYRVLANIFGTQAIMRDVGPVGRPGGRRTVPDLLVVPPLDPPALHVIYMSVTPRPLSDDPTLMSNTKQAYHELSQGPPYPFGIVIPQELLVDSLGVELWLGAVWEMAWGRLNSDAAQLTIDGFAIDSPYPRFEPDEMSWTEITQKVLDELGIE